ncbi:MAG TPA: hypothetical protein VFS66_08570 [Acidimicrobiia bacterium]|nr:hypothetical protein [Acidimicrobiia bacterium]
MSELRSLLDDLKAVDNRSLSTDELNVEIGELCRGIDQMKVLVAEKVAVLESTGGLTDLGFPSLTTYLMEVGRMRRTGQTFCDPSQGTGLGPRGLSGLVGRPHLLRSGKPAVPDGRRRS